MAGAFCELTIARTLMRNPTNKLPESPKKDGGGIKVVAQKTENDPGQDDSQEADHKIGGKERENKDDRGGEESRAGGQTIETVNEIKGIGDEQDPKNGERQTNRKVKGMTGEDQIEVVNPIAAEIEDGCGDGLNKEFYSGANAA